LSSKVIHVKSSYKFLPTVHNILTNVNHHIVSLFIKSFQIIASLSTFATRSWLSDVSWSLTFEISSLDFSRHLTAYLCSLSISFFQHS
jgi:hypothetical protein